MFDEKKYQKEYYQHHKEALRADKRRYYQDNKEECKSRLKESYRKYRQGKEETRAYGRELYRKVIEASRASARIRTKRHRDANRDKLREEAKIRYHKNVKESRMHLRMWRHNKGFKYKGDGGVTSAKRRALLRKGPSMTPKLYLGTFAENRMFYGVLTCWLCFKPIVGEHGHLEHDLEPVRGGLNIKGNLGVAHGACNLSKGIRTRAEYWKQEGIEIKGRANES